MAVAGKYEDAVSFFWQGRIGQEGLKNGTLPGLRWSWREPKRFLQEGTSYQGSFRRENCREPMACLSGVCSFAKAGEERGWRRPTNRVPALRKSQN